MFVVIDACKLSNQSISLVPSKERCEEKLPIFSGEGNRIIKEYSIFPLLDGEDVDEGDLDECSPEEHIAGVEL